MRTLNWRMMILEKYIYRLEHWYDEDDYSISTELGLYSTQKKAEKALHKFKKDPRFSGHPKDFYIIKEEIDKKDWEEGFEVYYF